MPALSLGDLITRVYSKLDNNTQLYTQTEVTNAINESIRVLNLTVGWLQISLLVEGFSQPNRVWYQVPPGIVIPTRVTFEGQVLQRYSREAIGIAYPHWTRFNTLAAQFPVTYWIPLGLDRFAIFPADAIGGGQIQVTGIQEPTPLVNLTDQIGFSNDILAAFDTYAAHILQLKESPKTFSQATMDYQSFLKQLNKIKKWQGFRLPRLWIEQAQQEGSDS